MWHGHQTPSGGRTIRRPSMKYRSSLPILLGLIVILLYFYSSPLNTWMIDIGQSQDRQLNTLLETLHGRVMERKDGELLQQNLSTAFWQPWKDDEPNSSCVDYKTRFGMGLQRVWLLSYPGSGNTWIRYLLEGATGVFTGSVFKDIMIYNGGMLGEVDAPTSGRTLVQKTHGLSIGLPSKGLNSRFNLGKHHLPTILLIRDPAKAFISSWNFKMSKTNKHTASLPKTSFATSSFHEHVALAIPRWGELVLDKLLWSSAPVHVLHYEDLVQNTTHHLRQVLHFLRVPEDEGRLSCVSSHLSGSFRRIASEVIDPYTKKEKKAITNAVRRVNRLLLALNYPTLPAYRHLL